ncbi:MAG: hypothetical protein SGARI_004422 [Bacillariaceae sp.]
MFPLILTALAIAFAVVVAGGNEKCVIKMRNASGGTVAVHWVHPQTKETVLMKEVTPDPHTIFTMNSFVGHNFQIFDGPSGSCGGDGTAEGGDQTCKTNYFQVTEHPEQAFVIKEDLVIEADDEDQYKHENPIETLDLSVIEEPASVLKNCKAEAAAKLEKVESTNNSTQMQEETDKVMEALRLCTTTKLVPKIKSLTDEIEFQREVRTTASVNSENFTCSNPQLETSPDVRTEEWTSPKDNVTRIEHIKLDRPTSRIHVVEDFASPAECKAMEEEAAKRLQVASTADGKGGTKISLSRKAMQAAINPKFTQDGEAVDGNLIAVLSGRVYEYVNHVLGMGIEHHGQARSLC